jgi:hypothetical protein
VRAKGSARNGLVMSVLPKKLSDLVAFVDAHIPIWTVAPANVGLTPAQVSSLSTQLNNTSGAIENRNQAVNAAKAATLEQNEQGSDLRSLAAACIRSIKTYAEAQAKPALVYAEAQIDPPAPPGPTPPPGQPTDLSVAIDPSSGALNLKWKCTNPAAGTGYIIRRRAVGESEWTFVGVTGTKDFADTTFSAGPDAVQYTVQGTRSGVNGPLSSIFTINFGVPGDGDSFMVTSVTEGVQGAKLAA